ncbi:MAG: glycine cleavage system protein GcvH [Bacteroidales bacterium]|jgi:glycine cleavage system H protein|nr:glycine cleavage system protein GcvH [Bacteroidales bacterium]
MNTPENFHYTKDHEWLKLEGNEAIIGITDYAQTELGDIIFAELPAVGAILEKNAAFGTVEAVKAVSEVFMPVSGEVIAVNAEVTDKPEVINQDPYGAGWMIRVRLTKPEEVAELMDAAAYTAFIQ